MDMELLNINLPSFLRMQFPNNTLQERWQQKINNAGKLLDLQYLSMLHDIRKCVRIEIRKDQLTSKMNDFYKQGLFALPVSKGGSVGQGFSHKASRIDEHFSKYHCFVTKDASLLSEIADAHEVMDHIRIGALLDFPICCTEHFNEVWEKQKILDPIWQQAINTTSDKIVDKKERTIRLSKDADIITTSVFRYLRIRFSSHIPCSLSCESSVRIADNWIQLAKDLGREDEVQDALDIMNLPYEWDCMKGIAMVSTPVFKFMANSVNYTEQYIVQKESDTYPEGAPNAIKFPWRQRGAC
jgi:hypothetical protein